MYIRGERNKELQTFFRFYLFSDGVECNVGFLLSQGPLYVEQVLVELNEEQSHDEHGIQHEKPKHHLVSQLFQLLRLCFLKQKITFCVLATR